MTNPAYVYTIGRVFVISTLMNLFTVESPIMTNIPIQNNVGPSVSKHDFA